MTNYELLKTLSQMPVTPDLLHRIPDLLHVIKKCDEQNPSECESINRVKNEIYCGIDCLICPLRAANVCNHPKRDCDTNILNWLNAEVSMKG